MFKIALREDGVVSHMHYLRKCIFWYNKYFSRNSAFYFQTANTQEKLTTVVNLNIVHIRLTNESWIKVQLRETIPFTPNPPNALSCSLIAFSGINVLETLKLSSKTKFRHGLNFCPHCYIKLRFRCSRILLITSVWKYG